MRFVSIDNFQKDILSEVPGCSKYTIQDAVRRAVIEFCKEVSISVETTEGIDLEEGEAILDLPSPSGQVKPWQVLWMKHDEGSVDPIDRRGMVDKGWKWGHIESKRPDLYTVISRSQVQLLGTPTEDADEVLTVHCSYIPKSDATRIDERVYDEYNEAIVNGALSKLLRQNRQDWFNPVLAREYKADFSLDMNHARALADKDFTTGPQFVQMNPMA